MGMLFTTSFLDRLLCENMSRLRWRLRVRWSLIQRSVCSNTGMPVNEQASLKAKGVDRMISDQVPFCHVIRTFSIQRAP